ncbi:site-specific integrase [Streptomyces sp. BE308]|uniref:site-specific integrase n=1 Tax=Streptomyces sp. BE308 TaxID=3002529 RepID=UPI002E76B7B7|nr:site-specific integrase [Streptomyces sp. BE308]MEE1789409.1 site-specific integrase [Streptomyces sp. BE308]
MHPTRIRTYIAQALASTGLTDASGEPLTMQPHDFRRIFISDAVMNGMPPHIAQLVVGHRVIDTTMGYLAVYPERSLKPTAPSAPAAGPPDPARSTAHPPMRSGTPFSATSRSGNSPSGPAAGHSPLLAFMSTSACDAPCSGQTLPDDPGSSRSATTSSTA